MRLAAEMQSADPACPKADDRRPEKCHRRRLRCRRIREFIIAESAAAGFARAMF